MRLFDITISILALFILLPVFAVIIPILRFTGEGEIFFLQERVGQFGNTFKVIKFATMLKNSPNIGTGTITSKNDPRILLVGRVLRKTKINEFPQFVNVLFGEMSLIGPRPHAKRDLDGIQVSDLNTILKMKPGLSGVGSIVFRNEEKILNTFEDSRPFYDHVIAPYKARLEIWYSKNRSGYLDLRLMLYTLLTVIRKDPFPIFEVFPDLPEPPEDLKFFFVLTQKDGCS
jgi:lipopolysaccharide/colanic/teichoic acid biosynthesis glycosyltransferase